MTKYQKNAEIAVRIILNNHMKRFSRDLMVCAEILNQIKQQGFVFDYTRFALNDQELASDIAYYISFIGDSVEKSANNNMAEHSSDVENIGELYCGDEYDEPKFQFDNISDFFPISDNCDCLSEVLSCMDIPHIIFDGTGYCYDGNYYSIVDSGIERMVLKVNKIQESDIDPLCLEILRNQM